MNPKDWSPKCEMGCSKSEDVFGDVAHEQERFD